MKRASGDTINRMLGLAVIFAATVLASGCASTGKLNKPVSLKPIGSLKELYAQLIETENGYAFRNFGRTPDPVTRNVNMTDYSYHGNANSSEVCTRGVFGLTSGTCEEAYEFSRAYTPPSGAVVNLLTAPFLAPFALIGGEGSRRFFPVFARVEFDYEEYYDAIESAQNSDDFSERYPLLIERYRKLANQYRDLGEYKKKRETELLADFDSRATLSIHTENLSKAVKAAAAHSLSASAIKVDAELSLDQDKLLEDPFDFDGKSQTLDDLEKQLNKAEILIADAQRQIEQSFLTVKFSLDSNYRRELRDYLAQVRLPAAVQWSDDSESITLPTTVTFKTASNIRKEIADNREAARKAELALQERRRRAEIAARNRQKSMLSELRNSVGDTYCANGEIQYYSTICALGTCRNSQRKETSQLVAYLEDFSSDAKRIQLRVQGWATKSGKTQHSVNSEISFIADQGWRQTTQPGVLFWSKSDDWYRCSQ